MAWYESRVSKQERFGRALAAIGVTGFALFAPISIAATQIALAVALAGILGCALGGWRTQRTALDLPIAIFVAAALASTVLSREGPGSPLTFTLWRHVLGFWIASQALALASDVRRAAGPILLAAALGLIAASILGLVQFWSGIDLVHALHLRENARLVAAPGVPGRFAAMGFFISRLTFGHNAMLLVALFCGAFLYGELALRLKILLGIAISLGLAAILLTFDRAAWLGPSRGHADPLRSAVRSQPANQLARRSPHSICSGRDRLRPRARLRGPRPRRARAL